MPVCAELTADAGARFTQMSASTDITIVVFPCWRGTLTITSWVSEHRR